MNVDSILLTFSKHNVASILIGGMNFLLRHAPVLTYDVDLWIEDNPQNLDRCERALADLGAEWGVSEEDWGAVAEKQPGWLRRQSVFCMTSPYGAIDVFRAVRGLESWAACRGRAIEGQTAGGVAYLGLADEDMLACQEALPEGEQNRERIRVLKQSLGRTKDD